MRPFYLILAAAFMAVTSAANAQEVPTEAVDEAIAAPVRIPQFESAEAAADQRRAEPRGSRPQGDNPRTGTAVPREGRREPPSERAGAPERRREPMASGRDRDRDRDRDQRRTVIVQPPAVYHNNYYNYPRRYYPHGYGAFGLGYFYYDPYRWYPNTSAYPPYAEYGYYSRNYGRAFNAFDIGELRLNISPRHAQVYVDGYYAGTVDDFDGAFQSLKMESGAYDIEIVAPGYETLDFKVRINPGQKTTFRQDLIRRP